MHCERCLRLYSVLMMTPAVVALSLSSLAASMPDADVLPGFRCGSPEAVTRAADGNTDLAFIQRSVAITRAALANDTTRLSRFVDPAATAVTFHYDNGITSALTGPKAVIQLLRSIAPRRYEYSAPRGLPGPAQNPCRAINIRLALKTGQPRRAYVTTFRYLGGILTGIVLSEADYLGDLGGRSKR